VLAATLFTNWFVAAFLRLRTRSPLFWKVICALLGVAGVSVTVQVLPVLVPDIYGYAVGRVALSVTSLNAAAIPVLVF
jgi:hypothetical protein